MKFVKNKKIELIFVVSIFLFIFPILIQAKDCTHCWCLRPDKMCEHHTKKDAPGDGSPITNDTQCNEYCYSRILDGENWRAAHCDETWIDWATKDISDSCFAKTASTDAGEAPAETVPFNAIEPQLSIPEISLKFSAYVTEEGGKKYINVPYLAEYIAAIYQYMVGVATILAIVMIMYGGFRWVTAAGDSGKIGEAKKTIAGAVVGLAIALGSYTILNLINPDLVSFSSLRVPMVERHELDWAPLTEEDIAENDAYLATAPASEVIAAPAEPGAAVEPKETGANNVPYFAQFNGPWAKEYCGPDPKNSSCSSVEGSGCRLTSYAMVLKYYFPNKGIDPGVVSDYGGCSCNAKPATSKFHQGPWGELKSESVGIEKAKQLVNDGKPVVILCRPCVGLTKSGAKARQYKGHYMVLTSYNAGTDRFTVNDPGSNPNKRIWYQTSDMMKKPCDYADLSEAKIKLRCDSPAANPLLYYIHPAGGSYTVPEPLPKM